MSFLSDLLAPFEKTVSVIEALIPSNMQTALGPFAQSLVSNFAHDAEVAAKAGVAVAKSMSKALVSTVWTTVEQEAISLAPSVLNGSMSFDSAVSTAVANLKTVAVQTVVPGLEAIGKTSLQTALTVAMSTAVSSLAANPTSTPVPQPVASSAA